MSNQDEHNQSNGYKVEVLLEQELPADQGGPGKRLRAVAYEALTPQRELDPARRATSYSFQWEASGGRICPVDGEDSVVDFLFESGQTEKPEIAAVLVADDGARVARSRALVLSPGASIVAQEDPTPPPSPSITQVQLNRTRHANTRDLILWMVIRYGTESLRFKNYARFIDYVLCGEKDALKEFLSDSDGPFTGANAEMKKNFEDTYDQLLLRKCGPNGRLTTTGAYRLLREATEWFLKGAVGVLPSEDDFYRIQQHLTNRVGANLEESTLQKAWNSYVVCVNKVRVLPYMNLVLNQLGESVGGAHPGPADYQAIIQCKGVIEEKLTRPCFTELIWCYWQEEGMLVQTINAIANRFQNRRLNGRDPLANCEMDLLRPLNNLFWGYVQDEIHRLSVARRSLQYAADHGMTLRGRAVDGVRPAEKRSKFLEGFHNFFYRAQRFFQQDDDTTVMADGFPLLNAIKEVHYELAQGFGNQFGDLPATARGEMLQQQWLLSRPEMRDLLGGRTSVPYPEPWMDRVDAMKTLQGWTDTSVVHFNDLAVFGEQIVLGIRYGGWSLVTDPASAANFAREWRPEIQGYMHAYRTVTGVDLGSEATTPEAVAMRDLPPSVHLMRRMGATKTADRLLGAAPRGKALVRRRISP